MAHEAFLQHDVQPASEETIMAKPTGANEGEGNKTADRNYRKATEAFVHSERGKEEIRKAGDVSPAEESEIRRAEEEARRHAKK